MNRALILSIVACVGCAATTEIMAQTVVSSPVHSTQDVGSVDFANAKPVPGRVVSTAPSSQIDTATAKNLQSSRGAVPGSDASDIGLSKFAPVQLVPPKDLTNGLAPQAVSPQQFGTAGQPFSTVRVDAYNSSAHPTQYYYPFRAAGKLFFNVGSASYVCSASLIKPGVIVTAAHCVANYGQKQFYSGWVFVPAYRNGAAPYGTFTGRAATVLTSYYNGTDNCAVSGVVCPDDVAVIVLNKNAQGTLPGTITGWLGYGYNGWGFNTSGQALITQIGYPVALDGGALAERNNSLGYVSASNSKNTIIGSLETGGSSGGPWTVNLGQPPALNGTSFGTYASGNVVVGVTSWGYTSTSIKQQGAAPFTSGNIVNIVNAACSGNPGYC